MVNPALGLLILSTHRGIARLNWPDWLIKYQCANATDSIPQAVTHSSTNNQARRKVTKLIETSELLCQITKMYRQLNTCNAVKITCLCAV